MSLKSFHLFFIAVSVLLAVGFGAWEIAAYSTDGAGGRLAAAVLSFAVAAALIGYGIRFIRKLKHVGYL